MFEHRLPRPVSPSYGHIALVSAMVIAILCVAVRHFNASFAASAWAQKTSAVKSVSPDASYHDLAVLVFKSEKRVEVWGRRAQSWTLLREYPVLAASGVTGPKLMEGDRQVPEGVYRVIEMMPHSRFHISIKLDYPNAFDTKMAALDGRMKLGGDICLQGKNCSIGCVAIGDPAIEDLFALIQQTGPARTKVIIAPNDLRRHIPVKNPYLKTTIPWLSELYDSIGQELSPFK